jgi:hypothetical protein
MDRKVRVDRRTEMSTQVSFDVASEINSMTRKNITTRTGRTATSYF